MWVQNNGECQTTIMGWPRGGSFSLCLSRVTRYKHISTYKPNGSPDLFTLCIANLKATGAYHIICEFSLERKRFPEMTSVLVAQRFLVKPSKRITKAKIFVCHLWQSSKERLYHVRFDMKQHSSGSLANPRSTFGSWGILSIWNSDFQFLHTVQQQRNDL